MTADPIHDAPEWARYVADSGATRAHVEYGVILDRTSKGLGYWLTETFRDLDRAQSLAFRSEALFGFPAEVKQRVVTVTDWQPIPSELIAKEAPGA